MNNPKYIISLILIIFALSACGIKAKIPEITIEKTNGGSISVPSNAQEITHSLVPPAFSVSVQKVEPVGVIYVGDTVGFSISARFDGVSFVNLRLQGGTQTFLSGTVLRRVVGSAGSFAEVFLVEALDDKGSVVASGTSNIVSYQVALRQTATTPIAPVTPITPITPIAPLPIVLPIPEWTVPCPPVITVSVFPGYTPYESRVIHLYRHLLGRAPEPYGLYHWTNRLYNGSSDHEIIVGIASSIEFYQNAGNNEAFLKALYRKLLHREADAAGLAGWLNALNAGTLSRVEVTRGFVFSAEYRGI